MLLYALSIYQYNLVYLLLSIQYVVVEETRHCGDTYIRHLVTQWSRDLDRARKHVCVTGYVCAMVETEPRAQRGAVNGTLELNGVQHGESLTGDRSVFNLPGKRGKSPEFLVQMLLK